MSSTPRLPRRPQALRGRCRPVGAATVTISVNHPIGHHRPAADGISVPRRRSLHHIFSIDQIGNRKSEGHLHSRPAVLLQNNYYSNATDYYVRRNNQFLIVIQGTM